MSEAVLSNKKNINDFRSFPCDICGNLSYEIVYPASIKRSIYDSDFSVFGELGEYSQIVKCSSCELVYSNPRDSNEMLHEKYHNLSVSNYLQEEVSRKKTAQKDASIVMKYMSEGNKRILDIGCSSGIFLSSLPPILKGYGVEPGLQGGGIAKNLIGSEKVHIGTLESAPFRPNTFDVITMWDVIEHLDSPKKTLADVRTLLKPDGFLFILTPNFESLASKIMGNKWPNLIRQHLYYYTPKTLIKLLEISGFDTIDKFSYSRFFTFIYLYKRLGFPFADSVAKISKFLRISKIGFWINCDGSMLIVAKAVEYSQEIDQTFIGDVKKI